MNPIVEIFGTLFNSIFVLIAAYGAIKQKKDLLLFGICFFSIGPVIIGLIAYAQDDNILHLFVIMVFLGQMILTLPSRYNYKDKAAIALSNRIGCAILVINLFQGYLLLNNYLDVPNQFDYMHLVIAIIMLYSVLRSGKEKI